jgi:nucleotide-binding universal stress UspA family protein
MKTILAPIDFSPVSKAVIAEAAVLTRAFHGRLVLLHTIQSMAVPTDFAGMYGIATDFGDVEKDARESLDKYHQELASDGLIVETIVASGPPVSSILDRATELAADYIVMGSHGHTALYDFLLGTTSHGVLAKAKCPVVLVRPDSIGVMPTRANEQGASA